MTVLAAQVVVRVLRRDGLGPSQSHRCEHHEGCATDRGTDREFHQCANTAVRMMITTKENPRATRLMPAMTDQT